MHPPASETMRAQRLLQLGVVLFLLGLLVGLSVPLLTNPRMGLASHLEGITNGIVLILLGLLWSRLRLARRAFTALYWLALYGTFANLAATFLAAAWGAGASMPIAAMNHQGSAVQEAVINLLLFSLSAAMIAVCLLLLRGLRRPPGSLSPPDAPTPS